MDGNTTDGLLELDVSTIDIQYGLGVGDNGDTGQIGQVLSSGGLDEPMKWVSNGVIGNQKLTQSTNIVISPNGFYDGTTASTISASLPTYTAGSGIDVSAGFVISANTDESTIENSGGTGTQLSVLKVPHKLTITKIDNSTIEFDGSADKSIDLGGGVSGVPPIFVAEQGGANAVSLSFSTTTLENIGSNPVQLSVKKVPETLTITQGGVDTIFDGSVAKTLTITDSDTLYSATAPITKTTSGTTAGAFGLGKDSTLTTISDELSVVKVPESLTISVIRTGVSTAFDGSVAKNITINDDNTEYSATKPIVISASDVISLDKDATLTTISDKLSVVKVPNTLSITTGGATTTFDGSTAKSLTIPNGSDTLYSATDPISKTTSGTTAGSFGLHKDATLTLLPSVGNIDELSVVKVPNEISINFINGSNETGITYDGSSTEGITITNTNTTYDGSAPIDVSATDIISLDFNDTLKLVSQQLSVKKVPNSLTITDSSGASKTFDGSSPESITINDNNNVYSAVKPITKTTLGTLSGKFGIDFDTTLKLIGDELSVDRVPKKLVEGTNITISVSGGYDGSATTTISSTNTEYTATKPIVISASDVISLGKDSTLTTISDELSVVKVPQVLTAGSGITFSSGTTYNGSAPITISSTPQDSENGTCVGVFNPSSEWEFPTSMSITYLSIHDWTKLGGQNFFVEVPATLINKSEYANFRICMTLYEEDRNAGTGQNFVDENFMNALLDFVDDDGDRVGDIVFFQSGGRRTLASGIPPAFGTGGFTAITGGRGFLQIEMILPRPAKYNVSNPDPLKIYPRLNNQSLGGNSLSAFHRLQAGGSNSYSQGSVRKPMWVLSTHPINPSNFHNYTT